MRLTFSASFPVLKGLTMAEAHFSSHLSAPSLHRKKRTPYAIPASSSRTLPKYFVFQAIPWAHRLGWNALLRHGSGLGLSLVVQGS